MSTMTAAVVEEFGKELAVTYCPVPEPGPGQALVKLIASGVCHTDLHAAEGDWPVKPKLPIPPTRSVRWGISTRSSMRCTTARSTVEWSLTTPTSRAAGSDEEQTQLPKPLRGVRRRGTARP